MYRDPDTGQNIFFDAMPGGKSGTHNFEIRSHALMAGAGLAINTSIKRKENMVATPIININDWLKVGFCYINKTFHTRLSPDRYYPNFGERWLLP